MASWQEAPLWILGLALQFAGVKVQPGGLGGRAGSEGLDFLLQHL